MTNRIPSITQLSDLPVSDLPETAITTLNLGDKVVNKINSEEAMAMLDPNNPNIRATLLHDLESMSYAEIAEEEGIPLGTVASRVFRGRSTVRRLWNQINEK